MSFSIPNQRKGPLVVLTAPNTAGYRLNIIFESPELLWLLSWRTKKVTRASCPVGSDETILKKGLFLDCQFVFAEAESKDAALAFTTAENYGAALGYYHFLSHE